MVLDLLVEEPTRPLFIGDTHMDSEWWVDHIFPLAKRNQADLLFQLGDFGVWPGLKGVKYLDLLENKLSELDLPLLFIDGNHEDFDQLEKLIPNPNGLSPIRPHILHVPRGTRWKWYGKRFLALGGGVSIDRADRIEFVSWWPQEQISYMQAMKVIDSGECDVLLSHDVPEEVRFDNLYPLPDVTGHRKLLQSVVDATKPELVLHGHMHYPYRARIKNRLYIGHNCNGRSGNLTLLDTVALKNGTPWENALIPVDSGPKKVRDLDREEVGL